MYISRDDFVMTFKKLVIIIVFGRLEVSDKRKIIFYSIFFGIIGNFTKRKYNFFHLKI